MIGPLILCVLPIAGIIVIMYLLSSYKKFPDLSRHESEKFYFDPDAQENCLFPNLNDEATVDMTIVVPSYNEEERLPLMLTETLAFMEKRAFEKPGYAYEIIIVDDGSKDNTTKVGLEFSKKFGACKIRVLTLEENRGKGGAVRLGMMSARGKTLLMADADGATKFADLEKVEDGLRDVNTQADQKAISCGSRSHLEKDSIANRSLFRTFLMKGFHLLVWLLCVRTVHDTQCGFKLLTRAAAQEVFVNLHVERWAFDVELLYIAEKLNIPIAEVAVTWTEIDGSKMIPVFSWIEMGVDLIIIFLQYYTGRWTIKNVD